MSAEPVVPPSGVVTFLFTDVEGSTRRWEAGAEAMRGSYATPVVVEQVGSRFHIPPPYGPTGWRANAMAAGGRTVQHKGKLYRTAAPTIVPFAAAAPLISARSRRSFHLYNGCSLLQSDITGKEQ